MALLLLDLEDLSTGSRHEFRFSRSPIRIGRSPLNDLPLERPFVSHCHAILHFDGSGITYVDLGSTNGSYFADRLLERNAPFVVPDGASVRIGDLSLTLQRGRDDGKSLGRATYASLDGSLPIAPASSPTEKPAAVDWNRVALMYRAYRASFSEILGELDRASRGMSPAERQAVVDAMITQCPELPQEAGFRRWVGSDTVSSPQGRADAEGISVALARRLGIPPAASPAELAERVGVLLHCYTQAFLELRSGHEQFVSNMGLSFIPESNPVATGRDARTLLGYLADPTAPADRIDDLKRAYADLMMHQVALLGAVVDGARAVVKHVDPQALAPVNGGALALFDRLWFGAARKLRSVEARLRDLTEDKTLTGLLFGREFARAYAGIVGRSTGAPFSQSQSNTARTS